LARLDGKTFTVFTLAKTKTMQEQEKSAIDKFHGQIMISLKTVVLLLFHSSIWLSSLRLIQSNFVTLEYKEALRHTVIANILGERKHSKWD
jgi:hypothetical protein